MHRSRVSEDVPWAGDTQTVEVLDIDRPTSHTVSPISHFKYCLWRCNTGNCDFPQASRIYEISPQSSAVVYHQHQDNKTCPLNLPAALRLHNDLHWQWLNFVPRLVFLEKKVFIYTAETLPKMRPIKWSGLRFVWKFVLGLRKFQHFLR